MGAGHLSGTMGVCSNRASRFFFLMNSWDFLFYLATSNGLKTVFISIELTLVGLIGEKTGKIPIYSNVYDGWYCSLQMWEYRPFYPYYFLFGSIYIHIYTHKVQRAIVTISRLQNIKTMVF